MKVVWTNRALLRLQEILEYIAEDQPANAARWVDRLIVRGESIGDQPMMGRMVSEYQDETIREVLEGDYRIVYKILPDRIVILAVRHNSRLLPTDTHDL